MYERLTGERVWEQPWPQAEEALLEREVYELVCQVNGKVRDRVQAARRRAREELKDLCRAAPNVHGARRRQGDRQGDRRAGQAREPRRALMAELKPAYLIHGDDHGAIGERRARLRALAEARRGTAPAWSCSRATPARPQGSRRRAAAMTFAIGRRVIIVDGAERLRRGRGRRAHRAGDGAQMPADTTIALFAREEGRAKAPAALHDAVKARRGQIVRRDHVKPWELADWAREQARGPGLSLDAAAAKALVAQVGERQQRLLRELEKLALEAEPGPSRRAGTGRGRGRGNWAPGGADRDVGAEEIERQRRALDRVARVRARRRAGGGRRGREATRSYLRLRAQGERLSGLMYAMAQRAARRAALSARLQAGEPPAEIKRSLRMPPRAADRFIADVARSEPERLRAALCRLADLELDTRGGAPLRSSRTPFVLRWRGHPRAASDRGDHALDDRSAVRDQAVASELGLAGQQFGCAGLLACAGVPVQRAALDGLVDRAHEPAVLGLDGAAVPALDLPRDAGSRS